MAVQGDLKDMGPASLIQFVCLEGRNAALYMANNGADGVLYFDQGQVAHAKLGPSEGEEAAYQLVVWQTGTFRLETNVSAPVHTISVPWRQLLMEGARRNKPDPNSSSEPISGSQAEQDRARGNELIQLMSELEYSRAHLEAESTAKTPTFVLVILTGMLKRAQTAHDERADETTRALDFEYKFAAATVQYPSLSNAVQPDNGEFIDQLEAFQEVVEGTALDSPAVYHQIGMGLTQLLSAYLLNLSDRFHSASLKDQWRDMCEAFITELVAAFIDTEIEAREVWG